MLLFRKIMKVIHQTERWLIVVLLFCAVITSLAQVFFRFVLRMPLSWSEELSRYLFIWMGMLGSSAALASDSHFRMDILILLFPQWLHKVLSVVWDICIFAFCCVMVYYGTVLMLNNTIQLSPALRISMAIPYASIPVAGVLMILRLLEKRLLKKEVQQG